MPNIERKFRLCKDIAKYVLNLLRVVEQLKKHPKTKTEDFHRLHLRDGCPRGQLYLRGDD